MIGDEIGQIRDELKEHKRQIDLLKEDIAILTQFANPYLIGQVNQFAIGIPGTDSVFKQKCERFVERYRYLMV